MLLEKDQLHYKMLLEKDQLHYNTQFDVNQRFLFSIDKLYCFIAVNYRLPLYYYGR